MKFVYHVDVIFSLTISPIITMEIVKKLSDIEYNRSF